MSAGLVSPKHAVPTLFDFSKARPAQVVAYETVFHLVSAGKRFVSVVLPPSYGKSHVIRLLAYGLKEAGIVTCSLVFSPNMALREQIVARKNVNATCDLFGIERGRYWVDTIKERREEINPDGAVLLSATMQWLVMNIDDLSNEIRRTVDRTGKPVLVFIDECHTGSEDNRWGDCVVQLEASGAQIALFTATPERADGKRIPGFQFKVMKKSKGRAAKVRKSGKPGKLRVDIHDELRERIRLVPDFEHTFKEAWREIPLPMCHVSHIPYDVKLSRLGFTGSKKRGKKSKTLLSELTGPEFIKHRGRIVRHDVVIEEGCCRLVEKIREFKHEDPSCAGIVFCASDTEDADVRETNKHAKQIQKTMNRLAPDLRVVIATTARDDDFDEHGIDVIEKFAGTDVTPGVGDVIIVKMMAGAGVDIPRLKVELDLSTVRTPVGWIQRVLRIGRRFGEIKRCTLITPADCYSRALFDALIRGEGGAMTSKTDLGLVESYEIDERELAADPVAPYKVDGVVDYAFKDTEGYEAPKEMYGPARALLKALPHLAADYSEAELANKLTHAGFAAAIVPPSHATPAPTATGGASRDIAEERRNLREEINDLASRVVKRALGPRYNAARYGKLMGALRAKIYIGCGLSKTTKLETVASTKRLRRIKDAMQKAMADPEKACGL